MHPDIRLQLQLLQQAERDRALQRLADHPAPSRPDRLRRVAAHRRSSTRPRRRRTALTRG